MLLTAWLWTDKKGLFLLFETSLKRLQPRLASDFWQSSCLNLSHAGITGMCRHAEALRVSQHLSDPPLSYTPRDTHPGSLAALSLLGNPAPRSGTVFLEQAGRQHWEAAPLPLPRQPGPTRLLSLLSHPGFICWLGPRLPPACLGFHNYNQPACAPYLSLLGGNGSTADRSGQQLKNQTAQHL